MKNNFFTDNNMALSYLLDKYQVENAGHITETGQLTIADRELALLPWRMERRFVELKKLIDDKTLEDVSTFRFAHLTSKESTTSLDQLIIQELDLCEWLGSSPIDRIFAVFNDDNAMNAIVKLENGISCSVECSMMLPADALKIDRHEIIARRGVASDQVVDAQVPQSSIYTYTVDDAKRFTDVDAEIFGLSQAAVNVVRASFELLSNPILIEKWQTQQQRLLDLVEMAKASEVNCEKSNIEGGA